MEENHLILSWQFRHLIHADVLSERIYASALGSGFHQWLDDITEDELEK